ncbi:cytochrome P450 [Acuticoccus mangrovi]|uniref:Cytochrome P450 n=1 Tax=Acuticoccus mangrovi TaxID=2796142 RepID=A0A934ME95_9HYPH|nr:cytochrome P450 [Acuticoccus mangrovi]MBJ3777252.1 cytochrome P450 [Acuticoccus mangrovi]
MNLSPEVIADHRLADSFVPPSPIRHKTRVSLWTLFRLYRQNLLAIFMERDYATRRMRKKVGLRTIHFSNHPDGVRETLHRQAATFEKKTSQQRQALAPLLGDGLFVSDGATWAERRAIVAPIVHGRRIATFAPVMRETAIEWCGDWRKAGDGATLDILFEMGELTAEIISRTIFGRRLGREFTREIIAGFAAYQRNVDQTDLLSLMNAPDWVPRLQGVSTRRARHRVHRVIDDIVDRFARGEGDPNAVISQLFAARDSSGAPLTKAAIRNEAIVIFMAGHETTANTLAWAIYLVSQSPRVEARLAAELEAVLGGRHPELADVADLTFTRAIIEETLRLYPPVPLLGRTATGPGTLNGNAVAKGDILVVAPWLLHRNRDLWALPDHFVPERFDPAIAARPDKHAYIPFASGPRVCPGLTFAITEATLCLATLLQAFKVTLEEGHNVEVSCRLTLRPGDRLPMVVRRRKGGEPS